MSNEPQSISRADIDKAGQQAKDYAREHPDQTRSVIDKIEDAIDARTGGKYSGAIDKAGDFVEQQLGLPNNQGGKETQPAPTDQTTDQTTDPSQPTVPTQPTQPTVPTQPTEPVDPSSTEPIEADAPTRGGGTEAGVDGGENEYDPVETEPRPRSSDSSVNEPPTGQP